MFINNIITKVYKSPFNFPKKQLYRSDKYTRDLGPDCMLSELANIAFIIVERKSLFNKTLIFELRIVICRIKEKVVITMARIQRFLLIQNRCCIPSSIHYRPPTSLALCCNPFATSILSLQIWIPHWNRDRARPTNRPGEQERDLSRWL